MIINLDPSDFQIEIKETQKDFIYIKNLIKSMDKVKKVKKLKQKD